jgi:hypothetical protein
MSLYIALAATAAALSAAAWPYIPKLRKAAGLSPSDRASWVNRLFALAAVADEAGDAAVAEASRELIATLVNHTQPASKRGR